MPVRSADQIAVLHFFRSPVRLDSGQGEMLDVHAWITFISTSQRFRLPYQHESVDRTYRDDILRDLWTFQGQVQLGDRRASDPINPAAIASIRSPMQFESRSLGERKTYRKVLVEYAKSVTERLGLEDYIFKFLFSLEGQVRLLQICTDELDIPWDWVYSKEKDRFLCEAFGIGVTQPATDQPIGEYCVLADLAVTESELASREKRALLIAGCYSTDRQPLARLDAETTKLAEFLRKPFGGLSVDVLRDGKRADILSMLVERAERLRLICVSGHFTEYGFFTADGRHLDRDSLLRAFAGLHPRPLTSEPLVILNGCRSAGSLRASIGSKRSANRELGRAFLDLGAGACIVTSTDVRLRFAIDFLNGLLERLLVPNTTLGSALVDTRNSMDKSASYEWATYHLLGDPAYVMVRPDV